MKHSDFQELSFELPRTKKIERAVRELMSVEDDENVIRHRSRAAHIIYYSTAKGEENLAVALLLQGRMYHQSVKDEFGEQTWGYMNFLDQLKDEYQDLIIFMPPPVKAAFIAFKMADIELLIEEYLETPEDTVYLEDIVLDIIEAREELTLLHRKSGDLNLYAELENNLYKLLHEAETLEAVFEHNYEQKQKGDNLESFFITGPISAKRHFGENNQKEESRLNKLGHFHNQKPKSPKPPGS